MYGLRYNIAVGVLFIEAWLSGTKLDFNCFLNNTYSVLRKKKIVFMDINIEQQAEVISSISGRLRIQQLQRYPDLRSVYNTTQLTWYNLTP